MRALSAVVLVTSLGLVSSPARACSCAATTLEASIAGASAIFEGVVDSVELDEATQVRVVRFAVTQAWRGVSTERVEVRTHASEASCGYPFEVGRAYLVYAMDDDGAGHRVSLCSRTRPMDEAGEDRAVLGSGVVPIDVVDEEVEPVRPARTAPSRAGCASCAVGSERSRRGTAAALALGLATALAARRARRRRRRA